MIKKGIAVLAVLVLAACANSPHDSVGRVRALLDDEHSRYVMVVAHRACWAEGAPENSISAIRNCIALGVDMVEIDVALTADGVPVLMHDLGVDRMTNGAGLVSSLTFAELRSLRLRAGAGGVNTEVTQERVPSLREVLEAAKGKILINLDVKGDAFSQAFDVVEALGMEGQILMKMSAAPNSPELRSASFLGRTLFMPIIRQCSGNEGANDCATELTQYAPAYRLFDPIAFEINFTDEAFLADGVETMKALGARIWVNTLNPTLAGGITDHRALENPQANWGHVVSLGANIIQTDRPRELISYLQRIGWREQ